MITFLIGHRGCGKTSLLKRIETYFREEGMECLCLDLDAKIAEAEGLTIEEIFSKKGEAHFRQLEIKMAQALADRYGSSTNSVHSVFVSLGAGFNGELPKDSRVIWIRRPTDSSGRIFLDRPRLDPAKSAIEEYLDRYKDRQSRYRAMATEELMLPEGVDQPSDAEKAFFVGTPDASQAILTVRPDAFRNFQSWLSPRLGWNLRFELRDDLLSPEQLRLAIDALPAEKILLSLRTKPEARNLLTLLKRQSIWDWPLEWDIPARIAPPIYSLHERKGHSTAGATVRAAGQRLERASKKAILKLAVEVRDFEELLQGHEWAMEEPGRRSFLPRSTDGRWGWYRLFMKGKFPLAYVREGDGSPMDLPFFLEWLRTLENPEAFAAILGDPVRHSRTPAEQSAFFAQRKMPVLAVPVSELDWDHGALEVLQKIGLRAAAVTSPLKPRAYADSKVRTPEAESLKSVNTLLWKGAWHGHNTDLIGLKKLLESAGIASGTGVAVWGGGGTLSLLEALLPDADFYSARTGEHRDKKSPAPPKAVVWGIGASRMETATFPPASWKPTLIVDLNYGEDSPGRDYALRVGARYVSGRAMFTEQAAGQRAFWQAPE